MDSHKLIIKFFADDPTGVDESAFVPVFHSFIQTHALPHHLLIDVADYSHVPDGPGVVLVSHEANIYMDRSVGGRLGLMYQRKQPIEVARNFPERLAAVFASAVGAAALLEDNPAFDGRLRLNTGDLAFRINDRLHGPNSRRTYDEVAPALRTFFGNIFRGSDVAIEQAKTGPLQLFQVNVKAAGAPSASEFIRRSAALAEHATAPSR